MSLIPGSGRSPGGRNGNSLQYSCPGNPMDRGTWQARVYGIAKELDYLYLSVYIQKIDTFKLWCWRRLLRVPWTAMRSNQLILKKSTLNIFWKGWSSSYNILATWCTDQLIGKKTQHIGKDPDAGKNKLGKRRKVQERMKWLASSTQVGANKFEQTQGENEGLGSLVWYNPWVCRARYDLSTKQQ